MTVSKNRMMRSQPISRVTADPASAAQTNTFSISSQQRTGPDYVALGGSFQNSTPEVRFAISESLPTTERVRPGDYDGGGPTVLHGKPPSPIPANASQNATLRYFEALQQPSVEGKSIGELHKARIQDSGFDLPATAASPPQIPSTYGAAPSNSMGYPSDLKSSFEPRGVEMHHDTLRRADRPEYDVRPVNLAPLRFGSESAAKVQDLLVQISQLRAENEQVRFLNAELTRSKMLLAAEVEMLRQDQVKTKHDAAAKTQDAHSELNSLLLERQSLTRQIAGLQTELRQREAVLDAVTEQRKQQNAALEGQEMLNRRMHDEVTYLQEQLQLRTEEARRLRDQIARERFKADEDVSKVTAEVSEAALEVGPSGGE